MHPTAVCNNSGLIEPRGFLFKALNAPCTQPRHSHRRRSSCAVGVAAA